MITRLNNVILSLPERLEKEKERVDNITKQIENIKIEMGNPFAHEAALKIKQTRLNQLDDLLAVEEDKNKETVLPPKEVQTIEHGSGGLEK